MIQSTLTFAGAHAVRMSIVVLMVGGGLCLVRRASARTRLLAWTTTVVVLLAMFAGGGVLPNIDVPLPWWTWPQTSPGLATASGIILAAADTLVTPTGGLEAQWLWPIAGALYAIGAGALLLRWGLGWRLTHRLVRGARPIADAVLLASTRAHAARAGLATSPRLVESELVFVPFVCGIVRPVVVMPATWREWSPTTSDAVLVHELAHIARRDTSAMHLATLYRALTWINPLSWWLRRHVGRLAEAASDDAVLAGGVDAAQYAETLLGFFGAASRTRARAAWNLAMASRGDGEDAEARITRVLSWKGGSGMALTMKSRLLIAGAVVLVAAPVMLVTAARVDPFDLEKIMPKKVTAQARPASATEAERQSDTASPAPKAPPNVAPKVAPTAPKLDLNPAPAPAAEPEPAPAPLRVKTRVYAADTQDLVRPTAVRIVNPKYTREAMQQKIQGVAELSVVVEPDGTVSEAQIVDSLDSVYGLDDQAITAALGWLFTPATLNGEAVAVRVKIQMQFSLR